MLHRDFDRIKYLNIMDFSSIKVDKLKNSKLPRLETRRFNLVLSLENSMTTFKTTFLSMTQKSISSGANVTAKLWLSSGYPYPMSTSSTFRDVNTAREMWQCNSQYLRTPHTAQQGRCPSPVLYRNYARRREHPCIHKSDPSTRINAQSPWRRYR